MLTYWINDITNEVFLSTTVDDTERNEILRAMKDFELKTCIRFIPRVTQRVYLSIEPRYGWVNSWSMHRDRCG